MRRRILITNFHPVGGGGHAPYIEALAALRHSGDFEIGVAAPERSLVYQRLLRSGAARLFACDFPGKVQKELPAIVRSVKRFRAIAREFRPDVVHANGAPDLAIAAWSHPRSAPYALVRTHHAIRRIGDHAYHRWLYQRRTAANVYVSATAHEMSTHGRALRPRAPVVIRNGVDLRRYQPMEKDAALAASLGIPPDCICFGTCAGTAPYKRVDTIIDAAVRLKQRGAPPFRILVVGQEREGAQLQALARSRGVDEFVYGGFHEDVRPYVALFDVGFVLSDAIETISFAAREMMAMGKPLLSSSFSGLRENVRDGEDGWLVEPGDVEAIAQAMEQCLRLGRDGLADFGQRARAHAEEQFSVEDQLARHAALYRRLLGR